MKIYINKANENWICDRLNQEFYFFNKEWCTEDPNEADVIWIMAPWSFNQPHLLKGKKVILTLHHIVPDKFNQEISFRLDPFIHAYHTPSDKSKDQIRAFTTKNIISIPWWINDTIWKPLDKNPCRINLGLPLDKFIIGSFQRDTEGADLKSPKLEKGPDQFCAIVEDMYKSNKNIHVLLGGWRRQYVINRLRCSKIPFTYIERPSFDVVNKMYNSLDLYIVASRYEGGPQSIPECAATKTPIISTDVGCADYYLNKSAIYEWPNYEKSSTNVGHCYQKAKENFIPHGFDDFISLINAI